MGWIALEGMRFHAFHGVYEAEKILGTEYLLDVYVRTRNEAAGLTDQLEQTINYETVYQICRLEMESPKSLIETVLAGIMRRMKHQFSNMEFLRVRVRKMYPPLGGRVDSAWVMEEQEFLQECPRCKSRFISYDGQDCWARWPNLHQATREMLGKQFGPRCLCDNCLKFYAG